MSSNLMCPTCGKPLDGPPTIEEHQLPLSPKHVTDSEECWCNPTVETLANGCKVIIHNPVH